ncbi:PRC-barrel domain containing protein [Oceanobacillus piezotolerans]|uniref:PRC-barrel domain containing protein n=1 Tax=Oceanobacillus piezotolerans TaxID=2448030 RepID=A0A498D491_9BACI|nr:PRC-barrel domain-containing protein [Oceanobacillus piezotolerans]RLL43656.1 PRC-barrel domain containing protein [Oceanobacillus piezotolerans]
MLYFTSQLKEFNIEATDGELGKIKDIYFDDKRYSIRYAIVDTRKWLPGRKVLLSPSSFERVNEEDGTVSVQYDKETVRNSPDVPENTNLTSDYKTRIDEYYGWRPFWPDQIAYGAGTISQANIQTPPEPIPAEPEPYHPEYDLRSEEEAVGFRVHANDGKLGKLVDFIYDDEMWNLRYIVVESNDSILSPEYYVYSTAVIDSVDWFEGDIYLNEPLNILKNNKLYKDKEGITLDLLQI